MSTFTYTWTLQGAGQSITPSPGVARTADHPNTYGPITLPVAKAGTLTTRTSDTAGTITVTTGHGIVTGDKIDIYWSGGMCYGATAGTVAGAPSDTSIPFTGAAGDVLPAGASAITVVKQVVINTEINGAAIQIIGVYLEAADYSAIAGHVNFVDISAASVVAQKLVGSAGIVTDAAGGAANPYAGNLIRSCRASNGSATQAATLTILSLEDSTP